ncbi:MAG: IS30 family transposase [Candidatus Falkowbacteria bacterium]
MTKTNYPLTFYERQQIEHHLRLRRKKRQIARRLDRDHSVIVREINRNNDEKYGYRAEIAQAKADLKAKKTNKRKLNKDFFLRKHVERELAEGYSPEQVAGRLKEFPPQELQGETISHESIYQYIYQTPHGKFLYQYLRNKHKKRQKHKSRKKQQKITIPDRISIHQRPETIDKKLRIGDWESDLIEFRKQKECVSVQYERKVMLVRLNKVANKTTNENEQALLKTIDSLPLQLFKSFTFDNGGENVCHLRLRDEFSIQTYFCDSYSSWQKGGVENINGLIREYLPKKTDLSKLTDRDIYKIQEKLNNRPRKSLGYLTPNEVIQRELNN